MAFLLMYSYGDRELILINRISFIAAVIAGSIGGCTDAGVSLICAGIVLVGTWMRCVLRLIRSHIGFT